MNDNGLLVEAAERLHLSQTDLASVLGVTQAALSAWKTGKRQLNNAAAELLRRALEALDAPRVVIGTGWKDQQVSAPAERWTPVFRPTRPYRLPVHIDWSARRVRQPYDDADTASLYATAINNGSAADVRLWVDPELLAEYWSDIPIDPPLRAMWAEHLRSLGYKLNEREHAAV